MQMAKSSNSKSSARLVLAEIQQYLTKSGDRWFRLPVAYDLVQRRWTHLNGSFFIPMEAITKSFSPNGIRTAFFATTSRLNPTWIGLTNHGIQRSPN
jgi:hypothetical protein